MSAALLENIYRGEDKEVQKRLRKKVEAVRDEVAEKSWI